jgi:hypothetical protein
MQTKIWLIRIAISSLSLFCSSCASFAADVPTEPGLSGTAPTEITTLTLPPTSTPKLEATLTENPLSDHSVLISFVRNASDGMDEISACLAALNTHRFVLYRNGQLIRYDEGQYSETTIRQPEIDELLSEIEATGFASLTGDGDQYIQNPPPPSFPDTWGGSITVNEKRITATPGQSDYLVEPVTKALDIIEGYKPENLRPYVPESISLWAFREQNFSLGLANPTPEPPVLQWSVDEINLDNLRTDLSTSKPQAISGDLLSFLLEQLKQVPALRWVEQNRQKYLVILCPNFP